MVQENEWQWLPDSSLHYSVNVHAMNVETGMLKTDSILDTGCDLLVVEQGWHIVYEHDEVCYCQGTFFTNDQPEISCQLVDVMAVLVLDNTNATGHSKKANQVLHNMRLFLI
jgi:hypothetical protein